MSEVVRETICSKCSHCTVCSYKSKYLEIVENLERVFYSNPKDIQNILTFRDPDCKFMEKRKEYGTLKNNFYNDSDLGKQLAASQARANDLSI